MEEFRTYKPFLSAVKNEYDSVLDKYARRLHYIPALRARLSTMEASTKQRVRREADAHAAEMSRLHNDANVLCMGSSCLDPAAMNSILDVWLSTDFEGGRHIRRVEKIDAMDSCEESR